MKWSVSGVLGSGLLALAAAVLLGRVLQPQEAGVVTAQAASTGGVASLAPPAVGQAQTANKATTSAATSAAIPADTTADTPTPKTSAPSPKLHFSYVGHWTDRGRTQVMLQRDGISFTVQGPGKLDEAYDVQAISAQQLTLLHRASGTRHALVFDAPRAATSALASVAGQGSLQAAPVGVVPPAHAPTNRPGDTEDQQESN
jgi:hypothetical protein